MISKENLGNVGMADHSLFVCFVSQPINWFIPTSAIFLLEIFYGDKIMTLGTVCAVRFPFGCIGLYVNKKSACLVPYHLKISCWVYSITSSVSF